MSTTRRAFFALALAGAVAAPAGVGAQPAADGCPGCGTVRSVREVDRELRPPSSTGAPASYAGPGDFPGGLGDSQPIGWVALARYSGEGGLSKGYVGAVGSPEMRERLTEKSYEIVVKLDNGRYQLVQEDQPPQWQAGDRVKIVMGRLVPAK
ncbi:MAG TPA: hypothetical protein VLC55_10740 [Burkholderiales bacterium]|nr:hypothetical protein [Burkholderiales bacterium]